MKAVPVTIVEGIGPVQSSVEECSHVMIHIPSRTYPEVFPVILRGSRSGTGCWTWNGDTESPTIRPSVLTQNHSGTFRCHSWVNDGKARFLDDCSHDMKNTEVDLLEVAPPDNQGDA